VSSSGNGVDSASATSSNSEVSNNIGTHLQEIVSQFANDNDITKKGRCIVKTNTNTRKNQFRISNIPMIETGAIGAGVAGIVIRGVPLSGREVIKIS
jgi:hypothetical protein